MNYFWRIGSTAFLVLISFWTTAQIQVTFPISRAVFQRGNTNQATLRVSGYYTASITRIEARLVARDGLGTTTDWLTLQDNPAGGVYGGDITSTGGWYNLEVRALNGSQTVGQTTTVERVGIGEVFIVAGQSNAQGVHQSAPNPLNDLVNCVNSYYVEGFPNDPLTPVFTQLDNSPGFTIAPRGVGSWCWGQLGDLLVKRLRVPIMFFNAAFEGTAVRNWRESAPEGGTAYSVYIGAPYAPRQPYINLKLALQFYANMLGLRAVLWHQGEADNFTNTPIQDYVNDLQFTIRQARQDFNRNVSWVVARASYADDMGSDATILAAQNQVISATPNVFTGPNTDGIQIPRNRPPFDDKIEGVHFDFNGLLEAANAWNSSLDDSFFQNSTPVSPAPTPTLSVACAGNNTLRVTVNGNYPTIQWDSGELGNTVTKGPGVYRAKIKDNLGNTFFSAQVSIPNVIAAVANNGLPYVCEGSTLNLVTNVGSNLTWVNQQTNAVVGNAATLSTTVGGDFYVRYRDVSGCDFTSNTLNAIRKPLPATPAIVNDKPTTFCQGDNTVLRTSTDIDRYNWSDGQQNKMATVGASGSYFLTVTDQFGCTSAPSNTIAVTANPVPVKPVIATNGPTTFCADRNITLTAPQNIAYQWTSGQTTQRITLNESGNFAVRTRNQFGCSSEQSDLVAIKVNPLPQSPSVSAGGSTTFCDGNQVTLSASSPLDIVWTSGQNTKDIVVTSSGNYAAQARDQIGCLSPNSTIIAIQVNPLPATPTILASPDRIICEEDKATLRVDGPYTVFWSTGDSTQRITTGTAGTYSARVRDVNGCISAQAGNTTVELRPLPAPPTINIIGTYTLEAISSANGTQFRWFRGTDSLAAQSAIIKASQTGLYTARSSTIYSPILTCYSHPSAPISFTIDLSNKGLSIYPNPNPDRTVILETQENLVNATVTIFTANGQQVFTITVPLFDERKQVVLTGLSSGSYLIRVQAASFDVSKRILLGL
ncbi:MAG: T9SS type A sorting domain-containing protein [Stigonema ocellatum SAG 48.90 = DSM 106950]|nr:T9SS type A sorting domain-containing protein [Stigonema ocellatum SAG 48.90 = DSM 106950]